MNDETKLAIFDKAMGALDGLPDVVVARPVTIQVMLPLVGLAQSFIVQTFRQRDKGDTVFLQTVSAEGSVRIALPPEVTDAIARQRDALTTKNRKRVAKAAAADRKARGIEPAFRRRRKA